MTRTKFPKDNLVPNVTQHQVGNVTYLYTGGAPTAPLWEAITPPLEITHQALTERFTGNGKAHDAASISYGSGTVDEAISTLVADVASTGVLLTSVKSATDLNADNIEVLQAQNTIQDSRLNAVESGQGAGVVGYATQAGLFANLNFDDGSIGYVTNDPTATKNGTYRKSGATGVGSWVKSSDDLASLAYQQSLANKSDIVRQAGIGLGLGFYPLVDTTVITDPAKIWQGSIIDGDFSAINYNPALFYSFPQGSISEDYIGLDLFSSTAVSGGGWVSVSNFRKEHIIDGQVWDWNSNKPLHLRRPHLDGYISITVIPSKLPRGSFTGLGYDKNGIHPAAFLNPASSVGRGLTYNIMHDEIQSIKGEFDTVAEVVGDVAINRHVFLPTGTPEDYPLVNVRGMFVEVILTDVDTETYEYAPAYMRSNPDGSLYVEQYAWHKVNQKFSSFGNFTISKAQIDSGKLIRIKSTKYEHLIDTSRINTTSTWEIGSQRALQYKPECVNPEYAPILYSKRIEDRLSASGAVDPRITLPSKMYAIVGKEFRLYYDAVTLLPDAGLGELTQFVNVTASQGKVGKRHYSLTATSTGNVSITFQVINEHGVVLGTKTSTIVVIDAVNPLTEKGLVCIGDSTTDDTSVCPEQLQANLAGFGGTTPVFKGLRGVSPFNHEARTGETYGFYADGGLSYRFTVTNSPTTDPFGKLWHYKFNGTGYILITDEANLDENGNGTLVASIWTQPTTPITEGWTGTLTRSSSFGSSTLTVTNTEVLTGYSPFKDNFGTGALNFSYYVNRFGLGKVDVLSIDLGINDCRGAIHTETREAQIITQAKKIIDTFFDYNPTGRVVVGMPKSCCSTKSATSANHDTYRMNIQSLRENILEAFDDGAYHPNVIVSAAGVMIDRYYAYGLATTTAGSRYTETYEYHTDDVHPRSEGLREMADGMTPVILYALTESQ